MMNQVTICTDSEQSLSLYNEKLSKAGFHLEELKENDTVHEKSADLSIGGMHCAACSAAIERSVSNLLHRLHRSFPLHDMFFPVSFPS